MNTQEPDQETEAKINQLSMIEQNLQNINLQKQQFQNQTLEVESALSELERSPDAYKIIGNLLVQVGKDQLKTELNSKKETIQIHVKNLEKQEEKIREKAKSLQEDILKHIQKTEVKGK